MELFSEVKNKYFQLVLRIINECTDGKATAEILKVIDDGEFEQKVIGKNQQSFADIMLNRCDEDENLNLLKEKDGRWYPALEDVGNPPVPVRFTMVEKFWLKALLETEGVRMILSPQTYEKLKMELEEIDTPIKEQYIEMTNTIKLPEIADQEAYSENFKTILKALVDEKPIRYTNTDRRGNVYKDMLALPVGIEYSMRDGRFRVSMYSIDNDRPIMANIFTLTDLRIVDEDVGIDRETAKKLLFEQKYSSEPIILEVTDQKAAMERCFMCFSGMERTARDLGNNFLRRRTLFEISFHWGLMLK
ncbi:MAG TPA: WYL domain-containing protein [Pseudobacteroides sp.]|mgnify:FL=1|nr:WYL domain-containing protein [Pseudobacteroides sp.]